MNLPRFAISHQAVVLAFVVLLLALGMVNFSTMSRREDPEITVRDALVITGWPGAAASKVEELVTDPLEKAVMQIAEVDKITSKSLVGVSIIQVTAEDDVLDTEQVWDEVRAKVAPVGEQLPDGVAQPRVHSDFGDVYAVCLALYQAAPVTEEPHDHRYTARQLEEFAEKIEDALELIGSVAKVDFWGVQPERIYVEVDSADWANIGLTASDLSKLFSARNIVEPGGEFDTPRGRYAVNPTGEFTSVAQMRDLIVGRLDGQLPVRLRDLPIRIDRRYVEPPHSLTRFTSPSDAHLPCLVLGVSMKGGHNVVQMGRDVDRALQRLRDTVLPPDIGLTRVNDLPRQVNSRILDFRNNLIQGVGIVLGLALLMMGWRPALIMAAAVPLSMIVAFAFVRFLGVELEQFSIASLIIALGMVVDNAIVISDNAYRLIREGASKKEAIIRAAQELAIPILTSTVTTVCAFLPMLTMAGNVGEYVASLPLVVAATLISSYFIAMLVIPIMCLWLLKPNSQDRDANVPVGSDKPPHYDRVIGWCLNHQKGVIGTAAAVFACSLLLLPIIGTQFFPAGLRDQFFLKVWLPEGSSIAATTAVCEKIETILLENSPVGGDGQTMHRLESVVTFVGTGGPRLMLTQEPEYDYPYFAQMVVNTTDPKYTKSYSRQLQEKLASIYDARVTVELFMLGPPIRDPVAFRLSGPDADVLREKSDEMITLFKQTPGTMAVRSDWGAAGYQLDVQIDPYAANLAGVTNADVALTTKSLLSGALLTTYREGDHLVPVMLRTLRKKRRHLEDLSGIFVNGETDKVPIESVARLVPTWKAAVVARRNNVRTVTVGCRVQEGELANEVAARMMPRLKTMLTTLPSSYSLEQGGEHEETVKAQAKVMMAVFIAILLIVLVLVVQYNSLLKPLVILFTVPLAMIGVFFGLWITGWAMGFMAMLGVLSLIGIVINNAIVLIDFIESNVRKGRDLRSAVTAAGRVRMRPILLTSLTTIGGLLPLSLFGGPLWAPMTNGMIFGLVFSTILTLIVVPTLYVFFAEKLKMKVVAGS